MQDAGPGSAPGQARPGPALAPTLEGVRLFMMKKILSVSLSPGSLNCAEYFCAAVSSVSALMEEPSDSGADSAELTICAARLWRRSSVSPPAAAAACCCSATGRGGPGSAAVALSAAPASGPGAARGAAQRRRREGSGAQGRGAGAVAHPLRTGAAPCCCPRRVRPARAGRRGRGRRAGPAAAQAPPPPQRGRRVRWCGCPAASSCQRLRSGGKGGGGVGVGRGCWRRRLLRAGRPPRAAGALLQHAGTRGGSVRVHMQHSARAATGRRAAATPGALPQPLPPSGTPAEQACRV
jgi:hypothetical protein